MSFSVLPILNFFSPSLINLKWFLNAIILVLIKLGNKTSSKAWAFAFSVLHIYVCVCVFMNSILYSTNFNQAS